MAVVRGLAVSPNAGADRCHAVELALDLDDDYADAMAATVVAVCAHPAAYVWQGSGLCVVHRSRLKHEGGWSMN
jgi:hypothetical protein